MSEDFLLLNPGPVPVTPEVRAAMDEPMISHRSAEFEAIHRRVVEGLEYVFTRSTPDGGSTSSGGRALALNGTATMGMEAAVANLVPEGGELVASVNGKFGRRFARIGDRYCSVTRVESEWGEPVDVEALDDAVTDETDVVTMIHNETSTGLLNPVEEAGAIARDHGAYFVVDGVTSIGALEFRVDGWNADVVITDAQKALATPPGISALYATDRAIEGFDGESAPFYEDLDWYVRKADDDQTPFTSAVPLFRAMAVALEEIEAEGMPDRIARHRRQAAAFRDGFRGMGLSLFANTDEHSPYSNSLTAVRLPDVVRDDPDAFFDAVAERGVSISGGQAHLGGEIFRVSNMGNLTAEQVVRGVRTVGEAMNDAGFSADTEAGVAAARDALD